MSPRDKGWLPKPPKVMPPVTQRALDLYDLSDIGSSQDRWDAKDRLAGMLTRMTKVERAAYYGELVRRRMEGGEGGGPV